MARPIGLSVFRDITKELQKQAENNRLFYTDRPALFWNLNLRLRRGR